MHLRQLVWLLCGFVSALPLAAQQPASTLPVPKVREMPRLTISPDGRRFATTDGRPFFWVGDTAWELLHRASRDEIVRYLDQRATQRFNAIQVCLLPEMNGLTVPNHEGELPFLNQDAGQPNPKWFDLAEHLLKTAELMRLQVALLPTWGSYVGQEQQPLFESRPLFNPDSAYKYGRWLAERFARRRNIVWMLGGDREPNGYEAVWRALAKGLIDGSGTNAPLLTFHPRGPGSSARTLHAEPWLSFNAVQSGHTLDGGAHELVAEAWTKAPAKPVINAEPAYEAMPIAFKPENGRFTADHVRRNWYWSAFSGAAGVTYGANEVWMTWSPEAEPLSAKVKPPFLGATTHWTNALNYPGANQIRHLRALLESRPWTNCVPDPALVLEPKTGGTNFIAALLAQDGSTALLYLPQGGEVLVNVGKLTGAQVRATWWSPTSLGTSSAGTFARTESKIFKAPSGGFGQDWVLVLDDAAATFPPLGQRAPRR